LIAGSFMLVMPAWSNESAFTRCVEAHRVPNEGHPDCKDAIYDDWIDSLHPQLALRAIRFANVRFGVLPSQSAVPAGMTLCRC